MVAKVDPMEEGGRLMSRVREEAIEAGGQIVKGLKSLQDQASEEAEKAGRALTKRARKAVKEQKSLAARKIKDAGSAAHKAARWLENGDTGPIAEYVEMAANSAERAASYLQEKSPEEITSDLAELARRHPVALFTGTLVAGLVVGRLTRTVAERSSD